MRELEPAAHGLFDRAAWRADRERVARAGSIDFLHAEIAERLIDRLDLVGREFPVALDLGAREGTLTRALAARPGTVRVVATEPAAAFSGKSVIADPELIPFR